MNYERIKKDVMRATRVRYQGNFDESTGRRGNRVLGVCVCVCEDNDRK